MRRSLHRSMFAIALLACSLPARNLAAQRYDPRERYDAPAIVRLSEARLLSLMENEVMPAYPKDAKQKGIQGPVEVSLFVDENGRVSHVAVSGNPLLASATVEAIKRLRFRPYYQNGEPVPSEGQLTYRFTLIPNSKATVTLAPQKMETVFPE